MHFATGFAMLVSAGMVFGAEPKAKPNVVVIVADGLGPRDLGCTGSTYYKTPNLDAFAKSGVKLEEAYSHKHVGLLLIRPLRDGLYPGHKLDPALLTTIKAPGRPQDKLHNPTLTYEEPIEKLSGVAPSDFAAANYLELSQLLWDRQAFRKNLKAANGASFFATIKVVAEVPSPEIVAKYKRGKPGSQGDPAYAARIEELDRRIGEVFASLDDEKLADDTYVVVTSVRTSHTDDWDPKTLLTSNAPYRDGSGLLYEGALRVPFLIRGPGIKTVGFPIITSDVLPTLVGLCGLKASAVYDGTDLSRQFLGKAEPNATREFHWHLPQYTQQYGKPAGAIRVGSMKLIEYFEDGRFELFDLSKDIGESRNLAAEKPEVVKEMSAKLAAWRKEVGAKMPTPNPDYKPNPQDKDGTITMHARTASVTGTQLRFEPAPHKNTLGYWTNAADTASFEFTVTKPGTFTVSVLQGAGKGSGGAEVELAVGESKAKFTVKDTGGFQAFELREVGELKIESAGVHKLTVTPKTKPGVAVMDLREVVLKPKKE